MAPIFGPRVVTGQADNTPIRPRAIRPASCASSLYAQPSATPDKISEWVSIKKELQELCKQVDPRQHHDVHMPNFNGLWLLPLVGLRLHVCRMARAGRSVDIGHEKVGQTEPNKLCSAKGRRFCMGLVKFEDLEPDLAWSHREDVVRSGRNAEVSPFFAFFAKGMDLTIAFRTQQPDPSRSSSERVVPWLHVLKATVDPVAFSLRNVMFTWLGSPEEQGQVVFSFRSSPQVLARARSGCRVMNATVLGVAFWLPPLVGLHLHVRRVARAGRSADVGHEKAVAFRLRRSLSVKATNLTILFRTRQPDPSRSSSERVVSWCRVLKVTVDPVTFCALALVEFEEHDVQVVSVVFTWFVCACFPTELVTREAHPYFFQVRESRRLLGRVEELLVAKELWNDHKKPFFFPFSSAATCTNHPLEVDQRSRSDSGADPVNATARCVAFRGDYEVQEEEQVEDGNASE
ncbi:hypothetical protein Taro_002903 [Colocasia esculenta]|uniref:Uncharacterized protein n=1 Tax=Colocasia esculenta TaxID=4460 RepID=A0A843TIE2_COLES|nr:hypothetical protein [Colocasia esculenta]